MHIMVFGQFNLDNSKVKFFQFILNKLYGIILSYSQWCAGVGSRGPARAHY